MEDNGGAEGLGIVDSAADQQHDNTSGLPLEADVTTKKEIGEQIQEDTVLKSIQPLLGDNEKKTETQRELLVEKIPIPLAHKVVQKIHVVDVNRLGKGIMSMGMDKGAAVVDKPVGSRKSRETTRSSASSRKTNVSPKPRKATQRKTKRSLSPSKEQDEDWRPLSEPRPTVNTRKKSAKVYYGEKDLDVKNVDATDFIRGGSSLKKAKASASSHHEIEQSVANKTEAIGAEAEPPTVPVPNVICANGNQSCKEAGIGQFPCRRCHREFYCCLQHQQENAERHKPDCKTPAQLEVIPGDQSYAMWIKFSAPYLYDFCLNFVLVWPSLTVQWLPDPILFETEQARVVRHRILLGTHTVDEESNHLLICGIDISDETKFSSNLHVLKRITHDGEIHRARYMPQNSNIVATKSPSKEVFVFDCSEYADVSNEDVFRPTLRLHGHTQQGYGLSWSPHESGRLVSGSDDGVVCLWDINSSPNNNEGRDSSSNGRVINALTKYSSHTSGVEDVAWHPTVDHVIASAGDDKKLILWDTRVGDSAHVVDDAHNGDVNAVSFSPFSEFCMATGGSDNVVSIWDMRRFSAPLRSIPCHTDAVFQVQWSPSHSNTIASAGSDKKVCILNIENFADETARTGGQEDQDFAPKDCQFLHGGHVMPVSDISWNPDHERMIASVSEDNIVQVWKSAAEISNDKAENNESDESESMLLDVEN